MINRKDKIAFLRRVFGSLSLASDGVNVAVMCPNPSCNSRKKGMRKLSIQIQTDQAHCWVCGLKTRNSLVPILRKVGTRADVQEYARRFAPKNTKLFGIDEEIPESEQVRIAGNFQLLGMHLASRDPDIKRVLNYMRRRGYTETNLWRFRAGISDNPRFEGRVIIPSFDAEGFLNTYAARAVSKYKKPNYLIPEAERTGIIFNELDVNWKSELTLVEGPLDLMKCSGNATCLQGSTLTEDHLLFWRIVDAKTPIVLALDADAQKKASDIANLLASYDIAVRILSLGSFPDVGEMSQRDFVKARDAAKPFSSSEHLKMRIAAWASSNSLS